MASDDWREVARERGIPVWEGCLAVVGADCVRVLGILESPEDARKVVDYTTPLGNSGAWSEEVIPDLSDPDTRAGYLPRLARKHGCPENVAAYGVRYSPGGYFDCIVLTAGAEHIQGCQWRVVVNVPSDSWEDDALALARAWPADKRIG